jgi:hypothetical protein
MGEPDDGGVVFADAVRDLLNVEEQRRQSLEARGVSVITVSGTLVTLLLGLAALVTKRTDFHLTGSARELVTGAVVAFTVAALLAIAAHAPQRERVGDAGELAATLPGLWDEGADFARKKLTATRLELLGATQRANDRRATALLGAMIAQAVAVALLAWAVAQLV